MRVEKNILLIITAGFFVACSASMGKPKTSWVINEDLSNAAIIVLPFENQTSDMAGPEMLRKMIFDEFSKKGYQTLAIKEIDEKLREKGITDGGQLPYISEGVLKEVFGPKLACYGTVENFTFQNLGFIVRKKVVLNVKIVSLVDDKVVFEVTGTGSDTKFFLSKDEAKQAFVEQMAVKLVSNMLKSPLKKEARKAVKKIFKKIPRR